MTLHSPRTILLASSCIALFTTPALALDEKDFLAKLNGALKTNQVELLPDTMSLDGDNIRFENAKIKMEGNQTIEIGEVTIDDIEAVDGGYLIGQMGTKAIEMPAVEGEPRLNLQPITIEKFHVRANSDNRTLATTSYAEVTKMDGFTVINGADTVMSFGNIELTTVADETANSLKTEGQMQDFAVNLRSKDGDPKANALLDELKVDGLQGDIDFAGSLMLANGHLDVERMDLNLEDLGKFNFKFGVTGYTADFLEDIQKLNALAPKAEEAGAVKTPEQEAQEQQRSMEFSLGLLGLAQQLSINNLSLRFEDDSLTERLLAYGAKRNNLDEEQMKNSVKGMVPVMLTQWGLADLNSTVPAAVSNFIDDPNSLTISAAPAEPLPIPSILAVMGNPKALIELIKLQVTSND